MKKLLPLFIAVILLSCAHDQQPCPDPVPAPTVDGVAVVNASLKVLTDSYLVGSADGSFRLMEAVEGVMGVADEILFVTGRAEHPIGKGAFCGVKIGPAFAFLNNGVRMALLTAGVADLVLYDQDKPGAGFADAVTQAIAQSLKLAIADGTMTWGEMYVVLSAGITATVKAAGKWDKVVGKTTAGAIVSAATATIKSGMILFGVWDDVLWMEGEE